MAPFPTINIELGKNVVAIKAQSCEQKKSQTSNKL